MPTGSKNKVALKLMRVKRQFETELKTRDMGNFDPRFVMRVLKSFSSETSAEVKAEFSRRGFESFPYCIVMPCGERCVIPTYIYIYIIWMDR